jgi:hypothetical protein
MTTPATGKNSLFYDTHKEKNENSICSAVNAIVTLSLINHDILDIFVSYSAGANHLHVTVNRIECSSQENNISYQLDEFVSLGKPHSLDSVKELEDRLILLVAEAKDLAIGAC